MNVLGDKVGLLSAQVEANGRDGGGTVRIGGDYRGEGTVPNATITYVDGKSSIAANATGSGNGGEFLSGRTTQQHFWVASAPKAFLQLTPQVLAGL